MIVKDFLDVSWGLSDIAIWYKGNFYTDESVPEEVLNKEIETLDFDESYESVQVDIWVKG